MKKVFFIFLFFILSSFQSVKTDDTNYLLLSTVKLYITDDGALIIVYDGIVSPCFTKEYFDAYYPCYRFNMQEYLNTLKKQLQTPPKEEIPKRQIYRL